MLFNDVINAIARAGGVPFLVGGAVRDELLGKVAPDYDIEVHGLTLEQLRTILEQYGPVSVVGKAYGVLKIAAPVEHSASGIPPLAHIDWSLPRVDSAGRKPQVRLDPFLDISESLRRRDLTMNAMARNLLTHELIDPFGGKADIAARRLCTPDARFFAEDPLRFFRVMQFIGRFDMLPDAELQQICRSMQVTIGKESINGNGITTSMVYVARERVEEELKKLLLYSASPSLGFRWLQKLGRLHEFFPELAATSGIVQEPKWHPEGDVFEHSMQALDAMAFLLRSERLSHISLSQLVHDSRDALLLLYAALCHDLGKVSTTQIVEGRIRSFEHEIVGAPLAHAFLKRITQHTRLLKIVPLLVRHHMAPGQLIQANAGDGAYKRLALKMAPDGNLALLAVLACADKRGRNGAAHVPLMTALPFVEAFIERAHSIGVLYAPEPAVLTAPDLLHDIEPGPRLGRLLRHAYEIQINKGIRDKDILKARVLR